MNETELNIELNKWFNLNYEYLRKEVATNISNGQMSDYADDLLNLCIESFLNRSFESKLQMFLDNKISNFLLRCSSFQIRSGTSPFFNQYRKYYTHNGYLPGFMDETIEDKDNIDVEMYSCFKKEMENLNWYETRLLDLKFYQKMSYKEINKIYHLPLSTLKREVENFLIKIRNKCINC